MKASDDFRVWRQYRGFWLPVLLCGAALATFEFTNLDLWLQDYFYDAGRDRWWVDAQAPAARWIFYDAPKVGVWLIAVTAFVLAVGPARWRNRGGWERRGLGLAVITIATVPALAALGKNVSNAFCPSEVRRYGGDMPYVKLCEPYSMDDRPARRGHCFPAGHASGGFALMGLLDVRRTRRWRATWIGVGLAAGWIMGGYQMLKGAHYLSHTVTTMLLAWLVVELGQCAWGVRRSDVGCTRRAMVRG